MLNAGSGQPLTVTFTRNDQSNYNGASRIVTVDIAKATQVIIAAGGVFLYGGNAHTATEMQGCVSA